MSRDESSVALRIMIRGTVGSPGSGDDLANMVTSELPDGAQCFVISNRVLYRFRKFSTQAASGTSVIAPNAGGGRWVQEGPPAGAGALFIAATDENTVDSSEDSDWLQIVTALFAMQVGAGSWTFAAASCIATYVGPPARFLVDLQTTVTFTGPGTTYLGISRESDLTGTDAGFAEGAEFMEETGEGTQSHIMSCQRQVSLSSDQIILPKFRFSGATDLIIERLTLSAIPIA